MTVRDLLEALDGASPDAEVRVPGYDRWRELYEEYTPANAAESEDGKFFHIR